MTAQDDPIQGCYKFLKSFSDITALVGSTTNPDHSVTPWIWNGESYHVMTSTQACSIVVRDAGSWAGPSDQSTAEFPRIQLEIWSDPPRDAKLNVIAPTEARTRAYDVYRTVDRHLHKPYIGLDQWGTCLVFGCKRLGAPSWLQAKSDDKLGKLTIYYGISTASFFPA